MKGIDKSLANIRLKFERMQKELNNREVPVPEPVDYTNRDEIEAETIDTVIFNIERLFRTHKVITAAQIIECIKNTKVYRPTDERL